MPDETNRHAEVLEHLRRHDMSKARFEELAVARVVVGDIGAHDCIVVPITNDSHLCPFMVGHVHSSLPIPTLELETAGLRRFGRKYIFTAVCGADRVITDEALHAALSAALMQASSEGVAAIAVPAFGPMAALISTMEAAVLSFEDLTEATGIHTPAVAFVAAANRPPFP